MGRPCDEYTTVASKNGGGGELSKLVMVLYTWACLEGGVAHEGGSGLAISGGLLG